MGKRNKVTTRDIAEVLGVSQSTVSMILSNRPDVSFSEDTIQKVRETARKMGYKKSPAKEKNKAKILSDTIHIKLTGEEI